MAKAFFIGEKKFAAESDSYYPEEDSYLLLNCLEREIEANKSLKTGLDLGCGSGIQGLGMALKGLKVVCVDANAKALENARENFERAGLEAGFTRSDLFAEVKGQFDLIAFNPPYLPSKGIKYPDLEGGEKGRQVLDRFIEGFPQHLSEKGVCLFLQTDLNGVEETREKLERAGLKRGIVGRRKLFFEELLVFKAWRETP